MNNWVANHGLINKKYYFWYTWSYPVAVGPDSNINTIEISASIIDDSVYFCMFIKAQSKTNECLLPSLFRSLFRVVEI